VIDGNVGEGTGGNTSDSVEPYTGVAAGTVARVRASPLDGVLSAAWVSRAASPTNPDRTSTKRR